MDLPLRNRAESETSSWTAVVSGEDSASSAVCSSCWSRGDRVLLETNEWRVTESTEASPLVSNCWLVGYETGDRVDSSVPALVISIADLSVGPAGQKHDDLMVESSSKLHRLLWEMQYRGLKENEWAFSARELEASAGPLWDMTAAQLSCKLSSAVLLDSGLCSLFWEPSVDRPACPLSGLVLLGWTMRTQCLWSRSTRLLLRWTVASRPQGHSLRLMKLKPPKRAAQFWQFSFPTVHWA